MKLILLLGVYLLSGGGGVSGQLQDEIPTTQVGPCHRRPDGFARDLNHCSQYFICQNGRAIRGRCPGLLAFDADNEACTWREEVTCFQCPRDQVYALLPVANTCNQLYRCWLGRASIHTCPSNLVFDPRPEVRRCNFVHGTGCEGDSTIVERCPVQDGDTPFYMAHQTSCSSYYVCHGGTPIQRECASGLHFNRVLRICDIPESAGCTSQDIIGGGIGGEWDEGGGGGGDWGNQARPCPETGHGFVPHSSNCNAYYACNNQEATVVHCAPGLHWDHDRETCDRPQNARCWSHENPNPSNDGAGGGGIGGGIGGGLPGLPDLPPLPGMPGRLSIKLEPKTGSAAQNSTTTLNEKSN